MDGLLIIVFVLFVLLIPAAMLAVSWVVGESFERRLADDVDRRHAAVSGLTVSTLSTPRHTGNVEARLVSGSIVVGVDYFKMAVFSIKQLFGGSFPPIARIATLGRRAALVRLMEEAQRLGAVEVINVRFETSTIRVATSDSNTAKSEVFCHGTALIPR